MNKKKSAASVAVKDSVISKNTSNASKIIEATDEIIVSSDKSKKSVEKSTKSETTQVKSEQSIEFVKGNKKKTKKNNKAENVRVASNQDVANTINNDKKPKKKSIRNVDKTENNTTQNTSKTEISAASETTAVASPKKIIAPPPGFENKTTETPQKTDEPIIAPPLPDAEIATEKDKSKKTKKKEKKNAKKISEEVVTIVTETEVNAPSETLAVAPPKKVIAPPPGFEEKTAETPQKTDEPIIASPLLDAEIATEKDKSIKTKKKEKKNTKKISEEVVTIVTETEVNAPSETTAVALPKKIIAPPPGFEDKTAETPQKTDEPIIAPPLPDAEIATEKDKSKKTKKKEKKNTKKITEEVVTIVTETEVNAASETTTVALPKKIIAPPPGFEDKTAETPQKTYEPIIAPPLPDAEIATEKDKSIKTKKKEKKNTKKTTEEVVIIFTGTEVNAASETTAVASPKKVIAPPPGFEGKTTEEEAVDRSNANVVERNTIEQKGRKQKDKSQHKAATAAASEFSEKSASAVYETDELYQLLNQLDARRKDVEPPENYFITPETEETTERKESRWARRRKKRQEKMRLLRQQQGDEQATAQVVEKADFIKDLSDAVINTNQIPPKIVAMDKKHNKTEGEKQQKASSKKNEVRNKHKEHRQDKIAQQVAVGKTTSSAEKKELPKPHEQLPKKQRTQKVYSTHKNKKLPPIPDELIPMIESVERFIKSTLFIPDEASLLLGVSGGVDSVVMLDIMSNLAQKHGYQLTVAHCNHGLRGEESDLDEKFTRALAADYRSHFHSTKVNAAAHARKMRTSIENAARLLRYQFFEQTAKSIGAKFVLSAHTADDTAETLLLNLIRGSGLTGLAGIPPRRDLAKKLHLVRPLLQASKLELIAYANKRPLKWREDKSNASTLFMRNKIRHELLPKLRDEYSPAISEILVRTARILQGAEAVVSDRVENLFNVMTTQNTGEIRLATAFFETIGEFLQGEIIQHIIRKLGGKPVSMNAINRIVALKESGINAECRISGNITAIRDRTDIVFTTVETSDIYTNVTIGESVNAGQFILKLSECSKKEVQFVEGGLIEFFDAATLPKNLVLRVWRAGDSFRPLGLGGTMNISDFLTNIKVSVVERKRALVLCAGREIVWVCGKRISDKLKITSSTKRAIRAEIILPESGRQEETQTNKSSQNTK